MSNSEENKGLPKGMKFIGENDEFEFECQRCGACCMNRGDIILNAWDVFNAARSLNITPKEFINKYCKRILGGFSKLPIIVLGSKENGMCHFLEFDYINDMAYKCTINNNKPGACASHPLGIITRYDVKSNVKEDTRFIKVEQCENSKKPVKHKAKEWMQHYFDSKEETNIAHEFVNIFTRYYSFRKWFFMSQLSFRLGEKISSETHEQMEIHGKNVHPTIKAFIGTCATVSYHVYENYDISKPFMPQAEENLKKLEKYLIGLNELAGKIESTLNKAIFSKSDTTIEELLKANDENQDEAIDLAELAYIMINGIKENEEEIKKELKED